MIGALFSRAEFGRIGLAEQRGRSLDQRNAKGMIDHRPVEKKANHPVRPALDEARLRQQAIGVKLRQMFDEIVNEPIPADFLEVLRRADAGATGSPSGDE